MMTRHTVPLPDDLRAELQAKSEAEGKTIEVLAEKALRNGFTDRSWQELLEHGSEGGVCH
jgi:predicted transcriptional regulator